MRNTFTDYIKRNFENEIYNTASVFAKTEADSLQLYSRKIDDPDRIEIEDVTVTRVIPHLFEQGDVFFYALCNVTIAMFIEGRFDDYDYCNRTVIVEGRISLEETPSSLDVLNVYPYTDKKQLQASMSQSLVPYISEESYEAYARKFLKKYCPEAITLPTRINLSAILERIGLKYQTYDLSNDGSVYGCICFAPVNESGIHAESGTILIDENAQFMSNIGSLRFTLIHECVHWEFHRAAFLFDNIAKNSNQGRHMCVSLPSDAENMTDVDWMELQANKLAPLILMPQIPFVQKAKDFLQLYGNNNYERVIDELSTFFGVSRTAAKIRMVQTGFYNAIVTALATCPPNARITCP